MDKFETLRKISYLKTKAKYFELLCNKEIEFDCLNRNFEKAKEISKTYYIDEDHDEENVKIYDEEISILKHCLSNMKNCKLLDEEIKEQKVKIKRLKLKNKKGK